MSEGVVMFVFQFHFGPTIAPSFWLFPWMWGLDSN
jgi:hypothetical protein